MTEHSQTSNSDTQTEQPQGQPTHFDVLVIGTGLRESILAAALAKSGRSVLHVDERPYYGGSQATLSLSEVVEWATKASPEQQVDLSFPESGSSALPQDLLRFSRKYNISLCPTLVTAVSPFVEALVRSGVAKYASFKLLDAVALYEDGTFTRTAANKEDIFKDKRLSLIDKRKLMKFLMFATKEDFMESELVRDHGEKPISDFLQDHFSLSGKVLQTTIYAASLSVDGTDATSSAIGRIRKYLAATGRFGRSPFLVTQYGGIGEIIQGFCRICAVFGGTYVLGQSIEQLTEPAGDRPASVRLQGQEAFTADCLIQARSGLRDQTRKRSARALLVLRSPIKIASSGTQSSSSTEGSDEVQDGNVPQQLENVLFVIPPGSLDRGRNLPRRAVNALMTGEGTFSCPAGQYLVHLSTPLSHGEDPKTLLGQSVACLLATGFDTGAQTPLFALYYSQEEEEDLCIEPRSAAVGSGKSTIAATILSEICDDAIKEAFAIFTEVTKEMELFEKDQTSEEQDDES